MSMFRQPNQSTNQNAGPPKGRFAGVEQAEWTNRGTYFLPRSQDLPADYVVELGEIKAGKTMGGVQNFIVEATILESNHTERPAGMKCSWYVGLDKRPALGNIRQFCAEAGDCEFDEVDEASVEMVVGPDQPLKGTVLALEVRNAPTQAGKPFSRHTWSRLSVAGKVKYQK